MCGCERIKYPTEISLTAFSNGLLGNALKGKTWRLFHGRTVPVAEELRHCVRMCIVQPQSLDAFRAVRSTFFPLIFSFFFFRHGLPFLSPAISPRLSGYASCSRLLPRGCAGGGWLSETLPPDPRYSMVFHGEREKSRCGNNDPRGRRSSLDAS